VRIARSSKEQNGYERQHRTRLVPVSQLSRAHSAPKYHLTGGDKKISKADLVSRGSQKIFAPVRQPDQLQLGRRPGGSPVVGRALFTTDLQPQLHEINEYISLSPQLVGDHWKPA